MDELDEKVVRLEVNQENIKSDVDCLKVDMSDLKKNQIDMQLLMVKIETLVNTINASFINIQPLLDDLKTGNINRKNNRPLWQNIVGGLFLLVFGYLLNGGAN